MPIQSIPGNPPALSSLASDRAAAARPEPAANVQPQPSTQQLEAAARSANRVLEQKSENLEFSVDAASGRAITRLVDKETNTVLRQIPSQEMLDIAQALDRMQGLLLKLKA